MALKLYLVFIISWFLHLGSRFPVLGVIRFDLLLVCVLLFLAFSAGKKEEGSRKTETDVLLKVLVAYSVLTIPVVQWPGSVIGRGIPEFVKAIVFYYFTASFVKTEEDTRKVAFLFVGCQLFRILEPVYLHIIEGYWGSFASMSNWEYLNRLSGAPSDVVNPNGLAFIICTVLPFLYFLAGLSWVGRWVFIAATPLCLYALVLTGSRTGILGAVAIFLGILVKAKRRFFIAACGVAVLVVGFPLLSPDTQDRYLSIVGLGEKNEGTAEGRIEGVESNFAVALRRPLFGHGLGTSREANANFGGEDKPAHNLYAEVAQELGGVGLIIFVLFLKSIYTAFVECKRAYAQSKNASPFLASMIDAMQVWLWLNILFSFASYGLSSFEWYLLGGFSVVMQRLTLKSTEVLRLVNAKGTGRQIAATPTQKVAR
jgi:putative inorganic carbon (HCO3(-)) transporter